MKELKNNRTAGEDELFKYGGDKLALTLCIIYFKNMVSETFTRRFRTFNNRNHL